MSKGIVASAMHIADCAARRGIPHRLLDGGGLLQLGQGLHQQRLWGTQTARTGAIAEGIARNKQMVRGLLRGCGLPVPDGEVVHSADEAWAAAQDLGLPVTMKPRDGSDGLALMPGLRSEAAVRAAFECVQQADVDVIVERHHDGAGHRVLVVNGRIVAAATRPPAGSTGAPSLDCTHRLHPDIARACKLAARIVGLDIAGIDLVCHDIGQALEAQDGAIVDVSAGPDLALHLQAAGAVDGAIGNAIIDYLYPPGQPARIPVVGVIGARHGGRIAHALGRLLQLSGMHAGLACRDGLFIGGRRIAHGDCTRREPGLSLLLNRQVEAAVFEHRPEALLREDAPYDECDVGLIADSRTLPPAAVARLCRRTAVLNADDAGLLALTGQCAAGLLLYAADARHPALLAAREQGGRVVYLRDGRVMCAHGPHETPLGMCPLGADAAEDIRTVLAVAAGALALGQSPARIAGCLELCLVASQDAPSPIFQA